MFNAAQRMQGCTQDTPLTRTGFSQADDMGAALALFLGAEPPLKLYASPSGRALQTLAIISEHIGADWHTAAHDARLQEIDVGTWGGRTYAEIMAEQGDILDRDAGLFTVRPPGGEWYDEIAARLSTWIQDTRDVHRDRLVIMHGMSARVLRGILVGLTVDPHWKAPIAPNLPQGSLVMIEKGVETIVHRGGGGRLA